MGGGGGGVYAKAFSCKTRPVVLRSDMEKGVDVRTLSTKIFENCGNFWILEDYLLSSWNKTL